VTDKKREERFYIYAARKLTSLVYVQRLSLKSYRPYTQ